MSLAESANRMPVDIEGLPAAAVELAAEILMASRQRETTLDRSRSALMARMMDDVSGKKFTIAMADEVLRMKKPDRAASRMQSLIETYGVPEYFSFADQIKMRIGNFFAGVAPRWIIPFVRRKVRDDSAHVIISAEKTAFARYLADRREDGFRVNFNQLGEAVLGDEEADNRLQQYLQRLLKPGIDYCSVKLSSVVSQISLTGYDSTLEQVKEKLRVIYRAAIEGGTRSQPKFVNLDMEEYRDLHLTIDTFTAVLDEPEFEQLTAGIVLQAYLPDSCAELRSLVEWARRRHYRTGAGIKIRLVKGANLAMEQVEASLHDWPQAPYENKPDVDANFKRMLELASRPENHSFLKLGIASHNLFDVAFALLLSERRNASRQIEFEMLEGMANAQASEVRERSGDMIVYTPVCFENDFESAVAYLVRRLDENTAPGSFLGALFSLEPGTPDWIEQRDAFLRACQTAFSAELSELPNRRQNRLEESNSAPSQETTFTNEPDTDFSLPPNRQWARQIAQKWKECHVDDIPLQIGTQFVAEGRTKIVGRDPSRPGYEAYRYAIGTDQDVEAALQIAVQSQSSWDALSLTHRGDILRTAAQIFTHDRGDSIGTMMLDAGKAMAEADVEVSEAIDFANYYSQSLNKEWFDGSRRNGIGVVVVAPPWNFPYAIPAGGVMAALMAGNSVILKPAGESVFTAWHLANQLWKAGVPKDVLQFLPLEDGPTGKKLITDSRVAAVILTGSFATASMFKQWRPDINLLAETSGKNSMVISDAADLDLAIKDLVKGAFGHAGQKCSATSLALVHKHVYDDSRFRQQLKDAASSLRVGPAWDLAAVVTPVIREPDEVLRRGLTRLDKGESWLLKPEMVDDNPCLWSPGIRMGVEPGSWYHVNECFGPALGLIRVESLSHAIQIQNSNQFGLTGGLHSLDPEEIQIWRENVAVGNAYINRSTTGAIVRRQPFGGWKNSCVGPGAKAGGPNYVSALSRWQETDLPSLKQEPSKETARWISRLKDSGLPMNLDRIAAASQSYSYWWQREFCRQHDPSNIRGETNHFRYRARPWHILRFSDASQNQNVENESKQIELAALTAIACQITGCSLELSAGETSEDLTRLIEVLDSKNINLKIEKEQELASRLSKMSDGSIRIIGHFDPTDFAASKIGNLPVISSDILANGRIELLNFLREQSITQIVHRYGNII